MSEKTYIREGSVNFKFTVLLAGTPKKSGSFELVLRRRFTDSKLPNKQKVLRVFKALTFGFSKRYKKEKLKRKTHSKALIEF